MLLDGTLVLTGLAADHLVGALILLVLFALRCTLGGKLLAELGELFLLLLLGERLDLAASALVMDRLPRVIERG